VSGAERAALARMVWCGFCWADPGTACGAEGQHFARYLRAYRRGLISADAIVAVCLAIPVISHGQLVADMPATGGTARAHSGGRQDEQAAAVQAGNS
jgi:hypothetical protein